MAWYFLLEFRRKQGTKKIPIFVPQDKKTVTGKGRSPGLLSSYSLFAFPKAQWHFEDFVKLTVVGAAPDLNRIPYSLRADARSTFTAKFSFIGNEYISAPHISQ